MHITGEEDGEPVKVGVAITDLATGLNAYAAILAALLERNQTQLGQHVDVALLDCQVSMLANVAHSYLIGGVEGKRRGTQHASIVPYQSFPTKDGNIVFGTGNERQYQRLVEKLNDDRLMDPKFKTNALRVQHREEIVKLYNLDCYIVLDYADQDNSGLDARVTTIRLPYRTSQ